MPPGCQPGRDVDAAKLLNRLKMWPMVTIGAWLDENSKTFERKLMGVRSPSRHQLQWSICEVSLHHLASFAVVALISAIALSSSLKSWHMQRRGWTNHFHLRQRGQGMYLVSFLWAFLM